MQTGCWMFSLGFNTSLCISSLLEQLDLVWSLCTDWQDGLRMLQCCVLIDCKYLWISQCFREAFWVAILLTGVADSSIVEMMCSFCFKFISAFFNVCNLVTKVALKTCMVEWCEFHITHILVAFFLFFSLLLKTNILRVSSCPVLELSLKDSHGIRIGPRCMWGQTTF